MSRTIRGDKGAGYDYGGRRPGNKRYRQCPSKGAKQLTHKLERRQMDRVLKRQLRDEHE
jgi:hypothetical protein